MSLNRGASVREDEYGFDQVSRGSTDEKRGSSLRATKSQPGYVPLSAIWWLIALLILAMASTVIFLPRYFLSLAKAKMPKHC